MVPEPDLSSSSSTVQGSSEDSTTWQVFHLNYPNNEKHNAESVMIDSNTRQLVIVTKSKMPPYSQVFVTDMDVDPDSITTLSDTGIRLLLWDATDATTSADGQVVIIRMYAGAMLWPRRVRQRRDLVDILREEVCLVSVGMQTQGEGVALDPQGRAYFTHSEYVDEKIWQYDILG